MKARGFIRKARPMLLSGIATIGLLFLYFAAGVAISEEAKLGEQLFMDSCAECHQPDGYGLAGIYPSLRASEIVRGSGVDVALQLIIGRGEMPSFAGALSAAEMAQLINYVRGTFSGAEETISAESVAALIAQ